MNQDTRTPDEIAADHMANRCRNVTNRNGRPYSCTCTEEIKAAKDAMKATKPLRWDVATTLHAVNGGQAPTVMPWAKATDELGVIRAVSQILTHAGEEWLVDATDPLKLRTLSIDITPSED